MHLLEGFLYARVQVPVPASEPCGGVLVACHPAACGKVPPRDEGFQERVALEVEIVQVKKAPEDRFASLPDVPRLWVAVCVVDFRLFFRSDAELSPLVTRTRHVTPLLLVLSSSVSTTGGGVTSGFSAESPKAKQAIARRVQNGSRKSALAYRPLEDGTNRGEGATEQHVPNQGLTACGSGHRCGGDKGSIGEYDGFGESQILDDGGEPGLFGADGLLSIPKVKALLLLVYVAQVRPKLGVKVRGWSDKTHVV